ncbi:Inactive leucine-rich repeat receptor-like serine/threonine-protein kinase [Acorus calamus]|uniref:Inactive leucine-rich repeat receptor-like serine/threonine-protein kinase n=1 Tax=Acorus calamus TaxID=4465 RepID=A0AAV9C8W0_ACOCL|nr:Inactive leucine-rich repeat receptor-like serine/threonine-protein kinase [Acorus calamus]
MQSRIYDQSKRGTKKPPPTAASAATWRDRTVHDDDDIESTEDGRWCGLFVDLPLSFCSGGKSPLGLREVLRSSVQVLGMSGLGISEKAVLGDASTYVAKRFRRASVKRVEFGRRVERLAEVGRRCDRLVPLRAYLYSKRTKLVLFDYYPMGSLSDLLADSIISIHQGRGNRGTRRSTGKSEPGSSCTSRGRSPSSTRRTRRMLLNVHGNIKASNIFVSTNFSAILSDYGFIQLGEPISDFPGGRVWPLRPQPPLPLADSSTRPTQKTDVYCFGLMVLDVLGGSRAPFEISTILERKEQIKEGRIYFFEYFVEGRAKKQAVEVLDIALACTNREPEARPTAEQIVAQLEDVVDNVG